MHNPRRVMLRERGERVFRSPDLCLATMKKLILLLVFTSVSCVYWTPRSYAPSPAAKVIENVPIQKWDIKSCGAGSLSSVLQHHGDTMTMDQWQEKLPKTRGGVMSIDMVLAARERGFDAQLVTGDRDLVEAELLAGRPVILMMQVIQAPWKGYDFFHYIVLDGYDPSRRIFRIQFGDGHTRWLLMEAFEHAWSQTKFATIVIRPHDPNAEALRAAVRLEEEGKLALAAHAYREILQKDPKSTLAWTNLGNVEVQAGRRAAAEEAFRKALELDPDSADTLNNLAWLLYEDKRMEEAEPIARKAVAATAPDPWMRLDTLARILAARGNCDEARQTFTWAIRAVPEAKKEARAELEKVASEPCAKTVAARE
jgi:TolA-binding protein